LDGGLSYFPVASAAGHDLGSQTQPILGSACEEGLCGWWFVRFTDDVRVLGAGFDKVGVDDTSGPCVGGVRALYSLSAAASDALEDGASPSRVTPANAADLGYTKLGGLWPLQARVEFDEDPAGALDAQPPARGVLITLDVSGCASADQEALFSLRMRNLQIEVAPAS